MNSLFALSATMSFGAMGADCTAYANAYAFAPSHTQPTYHRIDDAHTDWYRYRQEMSVVLPVLKAI
jgi:hypothetical protein